MKNRFKQVVTIFIFLLSGTFLFSQVNMIADIPDRDPGDPVYAYVEQMPQLTGANETIKLYIDHYPYPPCGLQNKIEGMVILQFIVEKNGKLSDIVVMRSPDQCLSDAAIAYLQQWPLWEPGKVKGNDVSCLFTLPIDYNIDRYNTRPR